tara:strand:- start:355 stop:759 length:405 start_codon:yes stop_codon:yes gene_type:complete
MTTNSNYDESAKLLLRFTIGFLMLVHGVSKLSNGISGIEGMFTNAGIPSFLAYGVYLGEVLAPLMLIIGFRVKIASVLILGTMAVAIVLAHSNDIFLITKHGAWAIEVQMLYFLGSLTILLQGAGKYSVDEYKK